MNILIRVNQIAIFTRIIRIERNVWQILSFRLEKFLSRLRDILGFAHSMSICDPLSAILLTFGLPTRANICILGISVCTFRGVVYTRCSRFLAKCRILRSRMHYRRQSNVLSSSFHSHSFFFFFSLYVHFRFEVTLFRTSFCRLFL